MAASVTITNVFAALTGPIPLSQLDANFTTLVNSVNSAATFSNYYVDASGSPNSIVVTISAPTTFAYSTGVGLRVKMANTNTGATTVNVNGLGTKSVVTTSGSPVSAGQMVAGAIADMSYDGTNFQILNPSIVAVGAGGATTQVQYNSGGAFAGGTMTYNSATAQWSVGAAISGAAFTVLGSGSYATPQVNILSTAYGAGVDGSGNLFFKNANNGAYFFYNLSGVLSASITGNGNLLLAASGTYAAPQVNILSAQYGLGVDASGNLFFKNTNNGVYQFYNSAGTLIGGSAANQWQFYEPLNSINAPKNVATFEVGSFTGTLTGCTTSPTTTFNYSRSGNMVIVDCNAGLSATSNTTAMTITGVPAAITPIRTQNIVTRVTDNSAVGLGILSIAGTTMTFGNGIGGGAFTGSGTKGIGGNFQFSYQLT